MQFLILTHCCDVHGPTYYEETVSDYNNVIKELASWNRTKLTPFHRENILHLSIGEVYRGLDWHIIIGIKDGI